MIASFKSGHCYLTLLATLSFLLLPFPASAATTENPQELSNPSFEVSQGPAFEWTTKNLTSKDHQNCDKAYEGNCSFTIRGGKKIKSLKQELLLAGQAGDSFTLSGRAQVKKGRRSKACSAKLILYYADSITSKRTLRFSVKKRRWQYRQKRITAAGSFSKVAVVITCPKRAAATTFDNLQLSSKFEDIRLFTPYENEAEITGIYQAYSDDNGAASSPWGFTHQGIDFSTATDLIPFQAVAAGYVRSVELYHSDVTDKWHVNVLIQHNSAFESIYAFEPFTTNREDAEEQIAQLFVEVGDYLIQGETMGYLLYGEAGTHVHYSLIKNKEWICPETYFVSAALQSLYTILTNTHGTGTKLCYE